MDLAALEKALRQTNPTITEERAALASGRWPEYLRERVPPPPWFDLARRRAWQAAYDRAQQIGQTSQMRNAVVFPVWFCSNDGDVPTHEWTKAVVVDYDESYDLYEDTSLDSVIVAARLEEARIGFVMPSRFYAPQMEVAYRNQHYVAVASSRIERVVAIDHVLTAVAALKPTRAVSPFATDAEPAIELDTLDPELPARVRRTTDKLRAPPATS
jgi:hypothetical protein